MNCATKTHPHGLREQRFVCWMLTAQVIDVIAADAHDTVRHPAKMREAYLAVSYMCGEECAKRLTNFGWRIACPEDENIVRFFMEERQVLIPNDMHWHSAVRPSYMNSSGWRQHVSTDSAQLESVINYLLMRPLRPTHSTYCGDVWSTKRRYVVHRIHRNKAAYV